MAYQLASLARLVLERLRLSAGTSLAGAAHELKVERHTLERALRKATGKTFRELRAEVVGKKAVALLSAEPNRSVKEVAFSLGYQSPRAFSRFLKRTLGSTPAAARLRAALAPSSWRSEKGIPPEGFD